MRKLVARRKLYVAFTTLNEAQRRTVRRYRRGKVFRLLCRALLWVTARRQNLRPPDARGWYEGNSFGIRDGERWSRWRLRMRGQINDCPNTFRYISSSTPPSRLPSASFAVPPRLPRAPWQVYSLVVSRRCTNRRGRRSRRRGFPATKLTILRNFSFLFSPAYMTPRVSPRNGRITVERWREIENVKFAWNYFRDDRKKRMNVFSNGEAYKERVREGRIYCGEKRSAISAAIGTTSADWNCVRTLRRW